MAPQAVIKALHRWQPLVAKEHHTTVMDVILQSPILCEMCRVAKPFQLFLYIHAYDHDHDHDKPGLLKAGNSLEKSKVRMTLDESLHIVKHSLRSAYVC